MELTVSGKYLHVGSKSINLSNVSFIDCDDLYVYLMSGRSNGHSDDTNLIRINYQDVTEPEIFDSAADLRDWIKTLLWTNLNQNIVSLKNKTIGYWRMNDASGNAVDSAGLNTGLASNVAAYSDNYIIGSGFKFTQDTTKRRVYCGAISKTKYTISVWALIRTMGASNAIMIGLGSNFGGLFMDGAYRMSLFSNAGSTLGSWASTEFINRDYAHNWILEIDSVVGTAELYFDLKSLGKLNIAAPALTNLVIGAGYGNGSYYAGSIPATLGNIGLFDGFLTTDEKGVLFNEYKENYYPFSIYNPARKGNIAFTFDDGFLSVNNLVVPSFEERGIKGTFFIPSNFVGTSYNGIATCSWAQLTNISNLGHEIGYHGQTHTPFPSLTDAQLRAELDAEKALFLSNSIPEPVSLAYPNGQTNAQIKLTVAEYVKIARYTLEQPIWPYDKPVVDKFNLGTINVSLVAYNDISELKKVIDIHRLRGTNITLMWHNIVVSNPINGAERTIAYLNEIVDYCKDKKMNILTMNQLETKYA